MKKFFRIVVVVTILILPATALAGHPLTGGAWCDCNCPECLHALVVSSDESATATEPAAPIDSDLPMLSIAAAVLLIWLRARE